MIEHSEDNHYPLLDSITLKRDQLGLEEIDIDLLREQSHYYDPLISSISQRELKNKWDLELERDTINAESLDVNKQLENFSKKELKIVLENLVSLQLTEGCNGECPFCMYGQKKGVTAKYSYSSLEEFFHANSNLLSGHPFVLYWDSDPFDYRDGEHSFVDVFRLYRETLPDNAHYISTAIPKGGESDFNNFIQYLASEEKINIGEKQQIVPVRISITKQNIQRVEATLSKLTEELVKKGYLKSEINDVFSNNITTVGRFDNFILPLGPLYKKADDIRDLYSAACRDGVVIAPNKNQAVIMTAASVYEPTGQKNIDLIPGEVEMQVPLKVRDEQYTLWTFERSLASKIENRQTLLPVIKLHNGNEYSLSDKTEDLSLKLGRESAMLNRSIANLSRILRLKLNPAICEEERRDYIDITMETYEERRHHIISLINSTDQFMSNSLSLDEEYHKLDYFMLLTKTNLDKMDFLANQYKQGKSITLISIMANILQQIGRDNIDRLPLIMDKLNIVNDGFLLDLDILDKKAIRSFIESIHQVS